MHRTIRRHDTYPTLTPERRKLRQDAIRLRQELNWSERQIAVHLHIPRTTIQGWLDGNGKYKVDGNNRTLSLNAVHIMDCIEGMNLEGDCLVRLKDTPGKRQAQITILANLLPTYSFASA